MSQINIAQCDDCGIIPRSTFRAYNRCPKCYTSSETVIGAVDAERLVSALFQELRNKGMDEEELVALLERVEKENEESDD